MLRIEQLHLDYPFAGSRMLRDLLAGEGMHVDMLFELLSPKSLHHVAPSDEGAKACIASLMTRRIAKR